MKVVRLMRQRGQGNSVSKLYSQVCEEHSEEWAIRKARYLTACEPFTSALIYPHVFSPAPDPPSIPQPQWFSAVYVRDVMSRIDDVKARITSTYGSILKMDSTKKVCTVKSYVRLITQRFIIVLASSYTSARPIHYMHISVIENLYCMYYTRENPLV